MVMQEGSASRDYDIIILYGPAAYPNPTKGCSMHSPEPYKGLLHALRSRAALLCLGPECS